MPLTSVTDLGAIGLVEDKEPVTLPPNAWNEMQNMRCEDRSIRSFDGSVAFAETSVDAQTIVQVKSSSSNYLVYAGGDSIYSLVGHTETDISGKTYKNWGWWDSCVLGGVGIFNNGLENPQYWGGLGLAQDLPYDSTDETVTCTWDTVGMKAQVIRPFRYHLFALDVEDCSGRNRRKVHWSHPAEPGSLPITWDPTKPEYDAGFVELSDTPGPILDALIMRDTLQIYKEDAIYSCSYTGRADNLIFNFRKVSNKGLYARNCVVDVGGRHFFVSDGDIYIYDGTSFNSIADEKVKLTFFAGVNPSYFDKTYCVFYDRTAEVWLCYPSTDSVDCDQALVWDSTANTWSRRQIPTANCATFAVIDDGSNAATTWDDLTTSGDTWADITTAGTTWDDWGPTITNTSLQDGLVMASVDTTGAGEGSLYHMDAGVNTEDGATMTCYARRTHLDLGDKLDWHMVTRILPYADGDPFRVRLGSQPNITAAVTWTNYQTFDPDTDYKIDFRVSGRLHAIEFSSAADVSWRVSGYEVEFIGVGRQ